MKLKTTGLLLLLLLAIGATSCKNTKAESSVQPIQINASQLPDGEKIWYLTLYGTNSITRDTISIDSKQKISYNRVLDLDTLDLLLLKKGNGELLLPIIPKREGQPIKLQLAHNKWTLSGIQATELLQEWSDINRDEDKLLAFLREHIGESPAILLVYDGLERYGGGKRGSEWLSLYAEVAREAYDLASLLGMRLASENIMPPSNIAPYVYSISGEKEQLTYKEIIGKNRIMALGIFRFQPEDSALFAQQKRYFKQLDSLAVPSYSVLLNDSLPKGIATRTKGTKRYFLLDSIGASHIYIREHMVQELPTYMVVDSLRNIEQVWNNSDSLIQYVKKNKQK